MKKLRDSITNTKIDADNAKRYTDLPKIKEPSFQTDWRIENCTEVWSVRQAILNGADYDNIAFKCVDIKSNIYWAPCANCTKTFAGLIDLGKGDQL